MNDSISTSDKIRNARWHKAVAWAMFQVFVPFVFVIVCWPIAALGKVDSAFERTFFGADTLLVGAMLFIAIVIEIHIEKNLNNHLFKKRSLDCYWYFSLFFVLLFLVFYAAIKYKSMTFESTSATAHNYSDPMVQRAVYGCISGGILAIVWSLAAGLHINIIFREAELTELEQAVTE
ncbi:MAG TPA: hypothetical protein VG347_14665 [Verrucomicrobiae bacterium]|nr:hypothetical protein [Verrucomicrobiae bacterium]